MFQAQKLIWRKNQKFRSKLCRQLLDETSLDDGILEEAFFDKWWFMETLLKYQSDYTQTNNQNAYKCHKFTMNQENWKIEQSNAYHNVEA